MTSPLPSKQERMSAAEARELQRKPAKKNKFGAKKTVVDGIEFHSAKEAKRYQELRLLERAGEISHLELQPVFKLAIGNDPVLIRSKGYPNGRQAKYIGDFSYFNGKHRVVEDAKGFRTPEYKLKKALVEAMFPAVRIVEV